MDQTRASILIEKYLHDELSEEEMKELSEWLARPENQTIFKDHIEIGYWLGQESKTDPEKAYEAISYRLEPTPSQKKPNRISRLLKYAAIVVVILGSIAGGLVLWNSDSDEAVAHSDSIKLKKEDGEIETIHQMDEKSIVNGAGNIIGTQGKNSLKYDNDTSTTKGRHNTLYVPKGKTFDLVLSDGTQISLNADTKITYPTSFAPDQKRKVTLEGEAYFQVAKDSLRQFVVSTDDQEIKVYGTKFNVTAYANQPFTRTVLAEGAVGVSNSIAQVDLVPGEMATSQNGENNFEVKDVNPYNYTAWVQHKMVFHEKEFKEIIQILERKFDVTIENKYDKLEHQKFTATFEDENLNRILRLFSKSRHFEYRKKGNTITITPPDE